MSKTLSKYVYLQRLLMVNKNEYQKVRITIPDNEYNTLYGIKPNTDNSYTYSYAYTYSYNTSYAYAYNTTSYSLNSPG